MSSTQLPAALDGSGNLKVAVENSSLAVTGTFWQTTQPVSGTVTANLSGSISNTAFGANQGTAASASGAWPTYLTVSGSAVDPRQIRALTSSDQVTLANSSIAVTGTFWQATQPVSWSGQSVGITGTVPVSGTFWQATQPVSIAATVNTSDAADGATGSVVPSHTTQIGGSDGTDLRTLATDSSGQLKVLVENSPTVAISGTVPVSGTFWQATQPVSGTVTANISGSISNTAFGANQGTAAAASGAWPMYTTVSGTAVDPRQIRALTSSDQVTIANSSIAVTGTFWQATQPVSGTVTSNQGTASAGAKWSVQVDNSSAIAVTDSAAETSLSTLAGAVTSAQMQVNVTNTSIPVTGTFYPATQPVSGSVALNAGANTIGSVVLTSVGGTQSGVNATGRLNVSTESSQLFVDTFDSTLDTVNNWMTPTASGGGVVSSVSSGSLVIGTGTTSAGYSYLQSNPNFPPSVPSYLTAQFVIKLEYPVTTQTYRFWGFGTTPASPTTTAPLTNAVGFELYTDGKLYAVVYAGGTRTVIQDFSVATGNGLQPADSNFHRYSMAWRSDKQFFMIDSSDASATGNFVFPQVQTLPLKLQAIAGTSPYASGTITLTSVGVGDSGANNITISDATYGFRGATVDASGNLHVKSSSLDGTILDTQSSITSTGAGTTYNTTGYGFLSFQFGGIWAGAIRVDASNDGVNWIQQYVQNLGSGDITDIVTVPTIVLVEAATVYMRYYVVGLETGTITVIVTGNTGTIPTTSLLGLSFDTTTGVQQNVNVANLKTDVIGGLLTSDAPSPLTISGGVGQNILVDTQGYESLNITTEALTANVFASNDKVTWSALSGAPLTLGALVIAVAANTGYSFPCIARFIRFTVTAAGTATVYLRSQPWTGTYTTTVPTATASNNLAQIGATTVVTGGVAGTLAVGGNIAVGVAQTNNPIVIGGVDTGSLTRRLQTDTSGRPNVNILSLDQTATVRNIGSVSPSNNIQNLAALAVTELSQYEGQSFVDLLAQILIELRILNYYNYTLLTTGTTNSTGDEPAALRNDPNITTIFG
jgi:hypothetical protein